MNPDEFAIHERTDIKSQLSIYLEENIGDGIQLGKKNNENNFGIEYQLIVIRNIPNLVYPYEPKQIVIDVGFIRYLPKAKPENRIIHSDITKGLKKIETELSYIPELQLFEKLRELSSIIIKLQNQDR